AIERLNPELHIVRLERRNCRLIALDRPLPFIRRSPAPRQISNLAIERTADKLRTRLRRSRNRVLNMLPGLLPLRRVIADQTLPIHEERADGAFETIGLE